VRRRSTNGKTHINSREIVACEWTIKTFTGDGNLGAAVARRFDCGVGKHYPFITVLLLKLGYVKLVRVFPSTNFDQNILVVVITQHSSKLLVGHVFSVISLAPQR